MSSENMTIREMCDHYGVTARTLRFYESKELLSPIRKGQQRIFTRRDRARLKLILRGKRFGFSLEDIRQLLELYESTDRNLPQMERTYSLAQDRLADMVNQRDELNEAIEELQQQIAWGAEMIAAARAGKQKPAGPSD